MIRPKKNICAFLFAFVVSISSIAGAVAFTVDTTVKCQTIEGFGAHGALDCWWNAGPFYNDAFLNRVIDTMGFTISRNEFYPCEAGDSGYTGSPYFDKQVDFCKVLLKKAADLGEPMTLLPTIWTPPVSMKTNNATPATNDGRLKTSSYGDFARYLLAVVCLYEKRAGIVPQVLSPQNEPQMAIY